MSGNTASTSSQGPRTNQSSRNLQIQTQQIKGRGRGPGVRSITPLLRHLSGQDLFLHVELKNGRIFHGILHSCDDAMNTVLRKAIHFNHKAASPIHEKQQVSFVQTPSKRQKIEGSHQSHNSELLSSDSKLKSVGQRSRQVAASQEYELLHIRGSTIRYIHLPQSANIPAIIRQGIDRERAAADKYKRGKRK